MLISGILSLQWIALQDYVKILETNKQFNNNYRYVSIAINIVGQTIESDGYVDDYSIEVSSIDSNDRTITINPVLFQHSHWLCNGYC